MSERERSLGQKFDQADEKDAQYIREMEGALDQEQQQRYEALREQQAVEREKLEQRLETSAKERVETEIELRKRLQSRTVNHIRKDDVRIHVGHTDRHNIPPEKWIEQQDKIEFGKLAKKHEHERRTFLRPETGLAHPSYQRMRQEIEKEKSRELEAFREQRGQARGKQERELREFYGERRKELEGELRQQQREYKAAKDRRESPKKLQARGETIDRLSHTIADNQRREEQQWQRFDREYGEKEDTINHHHQDRYRQLDADYGPVAGPWRGPDMSPFPGRTQR